VAGKHFETRAELDRQMEAARQLRATTLAGAGWIAGALNPALRALRRLIRLASASVPRGA
jgi:hypothetical protein